MNTGLLPLACTTCAKSFAEGGGDAAGFAILFMLCMIVPVMGAIGFFMVRIARRERAALDPQFCDPIPARNTRQSLS